MTLVPHNPYRQVELEVLRAIKKLGEADAVAIGKELHLHDQTIRHHLRFLHRNNRIFIADYHRVSFNGPPRAQFAIKGPDDVDVKRPKGKTGKEHMRDYRKRQEILRITGVKRDERRAAVGSTPRKRADPSGAQC